MGLRLKWYGDVAARKVRDKSTLRLLQLGEDLAFLAADEAPVRTGALRESISAVPVTATKVRVVAAAPYAGFVHDGTSRQKANPFMLRAIARFRFQSRGGARLSGFK
jgi:HK97 gp10 family phage protein